jgi:hypothetical protein
MQCPTLAASRFEHASHHERFDRRRMVTRGRLSVTLLAAVAIALSLAACRASSEGDTPPQSTTPCLEFPGDIASFMASCQPDDVKRRFSTALNDGGLAPTNFLRVSSIWRACNAVCTGRVKNVTDSALTLEAIVDGRDWTIWLSDGTRVYRRGVQITSSDLQPGEVVSVASQDGRSAQVVNSFAE